MVLSDSEIIHHISEYNLICHHCLQNVRPNTISYGLSSAGYDLRCGYTFRLMRSGPKVSEEDRVFEVNVLPRGVLDPKNPNPDCFETFHIKEGQGFILNPGEYALAPVIEWLNMPNDLLGVILGKSTYARNSIIINCTPAEPGWRGFLTIEIGNIGTIPVVLYPGEGIAQILFFRIDGIVLNSYGDRSGKYQDQGILDNFSKVLK